MALDMALIQFYRSASIADLLEEGAQTCAEIGFQFLSLHWTPAPGTISTMLSNHGTVWNNYADVLGVDGGELSTRMDDSLTIALEHAKSDTQACQRRKTQQRTTFQMIADASTDYFLSDYQRTLPREFGQPEWRDFVVTPLCRERDRTLVITAKSHTEITLQMSAQITHTLDTFANAYRYLHIKSLHQLHDHRAATEDTALSRREVECLRWLASGKTLFEAATILGISERTLRFHITNARERLGVSTTVQAIVAAAFAYGFDPHDGRRSVYATSQSAFT